MLQTGKAINFIIYSQWHLASSTHGAFSWLNRTVLIKSSAGKPIKLHANYVTGEAVKYVETLE